MLIVGDVHGKLLQYQKRIKNATSSLQVGDMAVGFPDTAYEEMCFPTCHKFIRGNHDSPEECRKQKNYLGDYGYIEKLNLFYVSGGFSVDAATRQEGVGWWRDEELSYGEFRKVLQLYEKSKPALVVSHECPETAKEMLTLGGGKDQKSRTSQALQVMYETHEPVWWVFGHHHQDKNRKIGRTEFQCLAELATLDLPIGDW